MGNTKIIDFLEKQGKIDKITADKLRVDLIKSSQGEEQLLLSQGIVDDIVLAQVKSELFNIPYADLLNINIPDTVFGLIKVDSLKTYNAVPFSQEGNEIKIAMVDPFDIQAIQAIEHMLPLGSRLVVHISTQKAVNAILERKSGEVISTEVSEALEDIEGPVTELDSTSASSLDDVSLQNAPVARIVNSIFQFAIKSNASDIHIEPMEGKLRVRLRIHGILTEKLALPKHLTSSVISRIKIMADLKIDEKRIPQDGRITLKSGDRKVDIRVSTLPTVYGEKIVMRILESGNEVPALETSGLRGNGYKIYMDSIRATNGIILITGPTGSGKTRTLAGTLGKLNDPKVNIITLENPVEIRVPGVNQVQINPDVGLTFATGLRSILRQDPNIVMVGEIRDRETAQLAVEASLTGHLVLSTLHTNSAATAVPRLIDMGIEPYLLASTLRLVVAQRLPRRICPYCREAIPATEAEIMDIKKVLSNLQNFDIYKYATDFCKAEKSKIGNTVGSAVMAGAPVNTDGPSGSTDVKCPEVTPDGKQILYLYKGKGCDRCNGTGYSGRIGIFEVMSITESMGRMMMDNSTASDIENEGVKNGMILMKQDGYLKALEGVTTIEEVMRVSKD